MISDDSVYKIGFISKAHGLHGELNFHFTDDIFESTSSPYLLIRVDGIIVPFFIEHLRYRSENVAIVKLEGIDNIEQTQLLVGNDVLFERSKADATASDGFTLEYFIGFQVIDSDGIEKGIITAVDDQTENLLFNVESSDGTVHYIPAHEAFIQSINSETKEICMQLPEGVWDL